jgi:signal transduction histidine kinase
MPLSQTIRAEPHTRLAVVIHQEAATLVERWARLAVAEQQVACRVHHETLLNHLPAFLMALAASLGEVEEDKTVQHRLPAFQHGEQRWENGWSLPDVVRDYQILRMVVLEFLDETLQRPLQAREILALNLAFDEAIAASVGMYVANREEAIRRSERELVERERHAEAQRLRMQTDALQEADRRKDEFLAVLGHELRNPLAPIRNVVEVFKAKPPDAETVQWATGVVERQLQHIGHLVDDLLDVTRIARGAVTLQIERLDLARRVRDTVEDQRATWEAAGLDVQLDAPAEPVWVRGDATRLAQVVGNLLHNAVKFTLAGGRIAVRLQRDNGEGRAVLTLTDSGVGIEPSMVPHVFELFRQSERSRHRSWGGLGLGLALVKGLVELHGGTVGAASEGPDRGATFTVCLPLDRPSREGCPPESRGDAVGGDAPSP